MNRVKILEVEPVSAKIEPVPAKIEPVPAKIEPVPAKIEPGPAKFYNLLVYGSLKKVDFFCLDTLHNVDYGGSFIIPLIRLLEKCLSIEMAERA